MVFVLSNFLEAYSFLMKDRKGVDLNEGRWKGTRMSRGKGNCNQEIFCEKIILSKKERKKEPIKNL